MEGTVTKRGTVTVGAVGAVTVGAVTVEEVDTGTRGKFLKYRINR